MTTCVKVVRVENGMLKSATYWDGPLSIHYQVGEWTRSHIPNSGIFAFPDLDKAKAFFRNLGFSSELQAYECEYNNPMKVNYRLSIGCELEETIDFWNRNYDKLDPFDIITINPDFLIVGDIKLIKRLV